MSRPTLVTALSVLLLATLALAVVSTVTRARTRRAQGATPAVAAGTRALQSLPAVERTAAVAATPPNVAVPPLPGRPIAPPAEPSYAVAWVPAGRSVALRARPGGRVLASVGGKTGFGSRETLTVVARRGPWMGVTSTDLPNGTLGWVDSSAARLKTHSTHISLQVDLSRRRLELVDGRKVLRRITVGIGRPGSPTPTGRFAITDKLSGSAYGPYYGCCILALSGHQMNTPAGWQGGSRLAIHGTNDPSSIGVPSSAGCLHAEEADLRILMRRVPLGTPVFIRR